MNEHELDVLAAGVQDMRLLLLYAFGVGTQTGVVKLLLDEYVKVRQVLVEQSPRAFEQIIQSMFGGKNVEAMIEEIKDENSGN
jgi:hypothetical protein